MDPGLTFNEINTIETRSKSENLWIFFKSKTKAKQKNPQSIEIAT